MKKLLKVSLVAMLVAAPFAANATLPATYANDAGTNNATSAPSLTATADVASTSYVKGAYNEAIGYINELNTALAGKQATIDASHKVAADLIDDTNSTNKFVTASEKTAWDNAATAAASALQSGDNVSELTNDAGYITKDVNDLTNYTTTTDMNTALAGKQATIDATHKVAADLIDDTNSTNKFVTASEKTAWDNAATAAASALQSGDNVSELTNDAGYITKDVNDLTNYTTTTDMNTALAGKQATIDANNTLSGAYLTAGTVAETALDTATQTKLNNAAAAKAVTVHTTWGSDSTTAPANVIVNQ